MAEYIEREKIREEYEKLTRSYVNDDPYIAEWRFDEMIESLPAADVVSVRHGQLGLPYNDEYYGPFANCEECGADYILPCNYCRACGARMSDNFDADIDCIDSVKTNKIDAKWIYETGIESPEILGSGSSFSSVATISNEDDAKEAYKKGGRNYLLRYKYDNARRIIQYWNGNSWESH